MDFLRLIRNILYIWFGHNKFARGANNIIKYDYTSKICNCTIRIKGNNNRVVINKACSLNGVRMLLQGDNNEIILGNRVHINASRSQPTVINACNGTQVHVGDDSLLSNNIEIHTTDYHTIFDCSGNRLNPDGNIIIGDHVWIGLGVKILKGSVISDGVIVGAGSVVAGLYKTPHSIITGVPAKIMREEVSWVE